MATIVDNIPVYDLLSVCVLRPVPAAVTIAVAFFVASAILRILPGLFGPALRPKTYSPPLQAWAFHCKCSLFICLFFSLSHALLSEVTFRPAAGMEHMETLLRADPANAVIIRECAADIFLRETDSTPAMPWMEYPSYIACLNEAQGRRLLGVMPRAHHEESFVAFLDSIRFKPGMPPIPYLATREEIETVAEHEKSIPAPTF